MKMDRLSLPAKIALFVVFGVLLFAVAAFASGTENASTAVANAGAEVAKSAAHLGADTGVAWWVWPLVLLFFCFILGIIAVLAGVGGGVLYVLADRDTRIESGEGLHVIRMPEHYGELSPLLHVVPLQLLAYHTACARGTDVDKPRNLAKSVTVE